MASNVTMIIIININIMRTKKQNYSKLANVYEFAENRFVVLDQDFPENQKK